MTAPPVAGEAEAMQVVGAAAAALAAQQAAALLADLSGRTET